MSADQLDQSHLTREEYVGILAALHDAHHVLIDLQGLAQGQTVVPSDQMDFLARRARALVRACIDLEASR